MWHDVDGMGWWMLAGSVWILLLAVFLTVLLSHLVGGQAPATPGAIDIARERYAKGEINSEELEEIRRHLGE